MRPVHRGSTRRSEQLVSTIKVIGIFLLVCYLIVVLLPTENDFKVPTQREIDQSLIDYFEKGKKT